MNKPVSSSQADAARVPRVLIVEDRDDDYLLLLDELERRGFVFEHLRVENEAALRDALGAPADWNLVISDYSLPAMTAHDVLAAIKDLRPDLPCIVMSSTITEESAVDLLRAGARDFVSKERMTRLRPAIERELRESAERRRFVTQEAAMRQARARMQFALESVGVGTWEMDNRTGRVTWSTVLERLHGLPEGTFGGTQEAFVALMHPEDRGPVIARMAEAEHGEADTRIEYRTTWPDGSQHWMAAIGRTIRDTDGQLLLTVGVGMDITAQKSLEDQVRQAQKMESIGNLAGGVAHDFNNLLTVIAGECELAAARVGHDPETAGSLEAIRSATVSATALTRQLLTFSRRQVITPRLLRLDDHIKEFSGILRRLIEENVTIDFRLGAGDAVVRVDAGQMEQVLLNLVANARDAMPEGGRVTVETRAVQVDENSEPGLDAGRYLELCVRDEGNGMSAEVREHLFEPFFTTKPAGRGTGLGLATVHGIVAQSGGAITVRSDVGAGATFRILLPLSDDRPAAGAPVEPAARERREPASETILVIEDNAPLRHLAERILSRAGYHVLTAGSGRQAQQICAEHAGPIAVLLADVIMPDGSGPAAAEGICRQRPETKVIYMSGYAGDDKHALTSGQAFLQKPFNAAELLRAVREVRDPC